MFFNILQKNFVADEAKPTGSSATSRLGKSADFLKSQLEKAGIHLNGTQPWEPQIHNSDTFWRIYRDGILGVGESYMDGWWDCDDIDEMVSRVVAAQIDQSLTGRWIFLKHWLMARFVNLQTEKRAYQVGEQHYDVGNDLYQAMLDPTLSYSCGYWRDANNLHEAQLAKLRLVCQKLELKPNEKVLEIGCGWGSFAELAAREYGVDITGLTISKEQRILAKERCQGLPVKVLLQDYRQFEGTFDKIVSIGMFEHVGPKNYDTYMRKAYELMDDNGIFVLHTIGSDQSEMATNPWIHKYIFPNGALPSLTQISRACEPYFVIEDVHNFGPDYDRTLMAWFENFKQAWPTLKHQYDERFYRMWEFYLKISAGGFRSRSLQLYQVVLRKRLKPLPRYHSPR